VLALRRAEGALGRDRARWEGEAEEIRRRMTAHVAVHGHWTGLIGGKWSPHDEPDEGPEEDQRGGYVLEKGANDVQS
jgi:hypothetical protein